MMTTSPKDVTLMKVFVLIHFGISSGDPAAGRTALPCHPGAMEEQRGTLPPKVGQRSSLWYHRAAPLLHTLS